MGAKKIVKICLRCGNSYTTTTSKERSKHPRMYCSVKCRHGSITKVKLVCKFCGNTFERAKSRTNKDTHFCSRSCKNKSSHEWVVKVCEYCGKEFELRPCETIQKYCSQKCFGEATRNRVDRVCITCGKEFSIIKSHSDLDKGFGKYCSKECRIKNKTTVEEIKCIICDTLFKPYGNKKVCSRDCYLKLAESKRIKVKCGECDKEFFTTKSRLKRGFGKFCSNECRFINTRKSMDENSRGTKEYHDWKFACLERDKEKCVLCGATRADDNIEVHHVFSFTSCPEMRYSVEGGLTVCETCHVWIHSKSHCTAI